MSNILLVGESCVDEYVFGTCEKICPEAPAMCFKCSDQQIKHNDGMASNVFNNLKSINPNLSVDFITNNESKIVKRRFVDERYNAIVFRQDINDGCERIDVTKYVYDAYDYVIFSDYCKGFLNIADIIWISEHTKPSAKIFIDTKKQVHLFARYIDYLKINEKEYLDLTDINSISKYCDIIVTKGKYGASLITKKNTLNFPTTKIDLVDVCGAGDTFLAALVVEYIKNQNIEQSILYANILSSKVVSKFGVCVP